MADNEPHGRTFDPASAREEAERLVAAGLAAVSLAADRIGRPTRERGGPAAAGFDALGDMLFGPAHHRHSIANDSPECCRCPVCRVIAAARRPDPNVAERLATGVGNAAEGLARLLGRFAGPGATMPGAATPGAATPGAPTPGAGAAPAGGDTAASAGGTAAPEPADVWAAATAEPEPADVWAAATAAPEPPAPTKAVATRPAATEAVAKKAVAKKAVAKKAVATKAVATKATATKATATKAGAKKVAAKKVAVKKVAAKKAGRPAAPGAAPGPEGTGWR